MPCEPDESGVDFNGDLALWRAVIGQALDDASAPARPKAAGKPNFKSCERDKARAWLIDAGLTFRLVCAYADLDHEAVRRYAREVMEFGRRKVPRRMAA